MVDPFFQEFVGKVLNSPKTKKVIDGATRKKLAQLFAQDKLPGKKDLAAALGKSEDNENPQDQN